MQHSLRLTFAAMAFGVIGAAGAYAEDVTATCKDGTSWSGAHRGGACRGHQGVQAFGAAPTANPPAAPAPSQAAAVTPPAPRAAPAPAPSTAMAQPAGGGAGQVWVNTESKVYHCQGDRYYGKTKVGAYMTEGAAKTAGDRPDHGKMCS